MKENKKTTENLETSGKKKGPISKKLLIIMIFIIGLGVFSYPIISNIIYERAARKVIQEFDISTAKIQSAEIKEKLNLAYAYNDYLSGITDVEKLKDPYTRDKTNAGVQEYARMLKVNEQIGHIIIPKISLDAPLYAGTSDTILQKGIGHMEGTSLPVGGNYTHAVLTGHRGLPTAKLFTELDMLEVGDKFYIKNIGGTIAYRVDQIKTVEPTDFKDLAIAPGHDYITLLTCTPYMINSHRLLVRGYRTDYVEAVMEKEIRDNKTSNMYRNLFLLTLGVLVLLLLWILVNYIKGRRQPQKSMDSKKITDLEDKEKE